MRGGNSGGKIASAVGAINKRYSIFVRGYEAALGGKPLKLGDLIYSDKWDQIAFERGWAFGRAVVRDGRRFRLKGRALPKEVHRRINQAVHEGVLL